MDRRLIRVPWTSALQRVAADLSGNLLLVLLAACSAMCCTVAGEEG